MSTLTAQRAPGLMLSLIGIVLVAGAGAMALTSMPASWLLVYWLVVGGATAFLFYAVKGDLLTIIMVWFVTLIALHEEFWRQSIPLFFAVTIPRIGIVVLALLFIAMYALGRVRARPAWPLSGIILAVATYFFLSAYISGFETRSVVTVHYRLIGGYIFPFTVFGLVLHAFHTERDVKRITVFFALIGLYLTVTGWAEQFNLGLLLYPRFINDPTVGIHWGRVRGPFVMSAAMGLALVYCYFNNLVLARNVARGRWMLYLLNAMMLPIIFWTKTRSVWLSFVLCSLLWTAYARRRTTRVVSVSLLLALGLFIGVANMRNFATENRAKGGVTDMKPILLRIGLAQMTWEMVKENPFFGVGFGHFRDYAPSYAKDPSSPGYAFGTTALEHNNMLSIMAETGLVGLLLYLTMMIVMVSYSVRLYRKLPYKNVGIIGRDLLVLYWILVLAYFLDGTFRETSDNPFANSLFFGLSAIPVALDFMLSPVPIRAHPGYRPPPHVGLRPDYPPGRGPLPGQSTVPPRRSAVMAKRRVASYVPVAQRGGPGGSGTSGGGRPRAD